MYRYIFILVTFFYNLPSFAQLVEVHANYTDNGDVEFIAYNNTIVPLFLKIDFADLQNTKFYEPLPYLKKLQPGFNTLFTLARDFDASDVPRFHYEIKVYRSNPLAYINLDFPYLIPFETGQVIHSFNVKGIDGFFTKNEPPKWSATGFYVRPGQKVCAARNGIVVEINGSQINENKLPLYSTWKNTVTILQSDGTLACYRNVMDKKGKLKPGNKVFAGQVFGEVPSNATEFIFLVYVENFQNSELDFIIPQFVTGDKKTDMIISEKEIQIVHPKKIITMEMTGREARKFK